MPIREHPDRGSIVVCDFSSGFQNPEMDKTRPVVVLTPKIKARPGLCTIVSLSTTPPDPEMPYHAQIDISPELPGPFQSHGLWIKGDMVNAVAFHRLNLIRCGKDKNGVRKYYYNTISDNQLRLLQKCVLHGMGMSSLTKHL